MIQITEVVEVDKDSITITDEEFEVYDVEIDSCHIDTLRCSKVRFDGDGDVRVELKLSHSEILLEHVSEGDIVKYLEDQGYTVEEGE